MNIAVCDAQPEVLDAVENMLRAILEMERVETYQDIRHMRDEFEDGKWSDVLIMDICHEYNTEIPETEKRQEVEEEHRRWNAYMRTEGYSYRSIDMK